MPIKLIPPTKIKVLYTLRNSRKSLGATYNLQLKLSLKEGNKTTRIEKNSSERFYF